ncbi:MAG TPA: (Fe-S)-binding protein [Jatrophihabitans sp.]|jgi:hypothetical protein|nr:(Fe-S)-binding protein [Jatrophihabitans sp.]
MTKPTTATGMSADDVQNFLTRTTDGSRWGDNDPEKFDFKDFFDYMINTTHLLLSKDEMTWMDSDPTPDRNVDVFVNMSCGTQLGPHVSLETVGIFKALGVNAAVASGRQFCCGKVYRVNGRPEAGVRMSDASVGRIREWGAETAVHGCPSCQIVYSSHLNQHPDLAPGLTNKHFSTFLEERLDELGDRVPWQAEVPARVLVEGHGPELSPVHDGVTKAAARILAKVPGVEVRGVVEPPSFGPPCKTPVPGGPGLFARLNDTERAQTSTELEAQAAARGADTIAPSDKHCHREWSKFATDQLTVRHYISIVAEALGCAEPDRFQTMWHLHDPEAVLEQTRPYWSSWGASEEQARQLVFRHFTPEHSAFVPQCACGGDASRCNTGRNTLARQ